MKSTNGQGARSKTYVSRPALGVIALLLAIVAMVAFIRQANEFQLRPASGTAQAISQAAAPPSATSAKP